MYIQEQKALVAKMEADFQKGLYKASIVTKEGDFAADPRLCLTSVVFLSKDIADLITEKIIEPLRAIEPEHYFYPPESLHLTIKNVQIISNPPTFTETEVQNVAAMFEEIAPQYSAPLFSLEDVVQFPTSVSVLGYCDDRLQSLVRALDDNLKIIGVPDNKKYFSDSILFGNVTICRFVHEPSPIFKEKLIQLRTATIGQMVAKEIKLIICNSVCHSSSLRVVGTYFLA